MKKLLTALLTVALFCAVLTAVSGCEHEQETALQTEQIYSLTACTEHEFGLYLEEKAATCTEKGTKAAYCAICGEKSVQEIEVLGHDMQGFACSGRVCSRCGFEEAATEHKYVLYEKAEPACTVPGEEIYVCECGETDFKELAPTGHSFGGWVTAVAATCTEEGTEERVCADCGATESRGIPAAGHIFIETVTREATCTADGEMTEECTECGISHTREVAASGHEWVLKERSEATCTEDGICVYGCDRCGETEQETVSQKLGHDFGDAPKCEESVVCQREGCGAIREPEPHVLKDTITEPTCTENGYVERYCTTCGKITEVHENAEPVGHDMQGLRCRGKTCSRCDYAEAPGEHEYRPLYHVKATCTSAGKEVFVCGCGAEKTVASAASGHDYTEWETVKEATCVLPGSKERTCRNCGDKEVEILPAPGHRLVLKEEIPVSCTEDGRQVFECYVCSETIESITFKSTGHSGGKATCSEAAVCDICRESYGEKAPHKIVEYEAKSPTCTEKGHSAWSFCSECDQQIIPRETLPALGHDMGEYVSDGNATCTEDGTKTGTCSRCGLSDTLSDPGSAVGHSGGQATCSEAAVCVVCGKSYGEKTPHTVVVAEGKESTCTEAGYTARSYCSECGEILVAETEIPAKGHDFIGTGENEQVCTGSIETECVCAVCGEIIYQTIVGTGHEWQLVKDVGATCTEPGIKTYFCPNCSESRLETIEKTEHNYDYVTLNGVGCACRCGRVRASEGNVRIEGGTVTEITGETDAVVVVPDTAEDVVWEDVFFGNSCVEYVYLGQNIRSVDYMWAFEGCVNLKKVYLSADCEIVDGLYLPDGAQIVKVDYNG